MNIFLVNHDRSASDGLMRKLAEQAKEGAIIPLTSQEMELYRSDDFQWLNAGSSDNQMITELEAGKDYVFVCNPMDTVIEDIMSLEERLNIKVGIVRVKS